MGDLDNPESWGLTPRIVQTIFKKIQDSPDNLDFRIGISYIEIYMEKIRDLLNPANDNLEIHEERGKGVYIKDLTENIASDPEDVYQTLKTGQKYRMIAATSNSFSRFY